MSWKVLLVGVAVGAAAGWFMGSAAKGGGKGITGGFAAPFQNRIDTGR